MTVSYRFNLIPKVSFGIIVLNGEPFTRYNLRALYPFAQQIIVVEGAEPGSFNFSRSNGHSLDNTLEILHQFKEYEDPENKVCIVTAEDEGHPNGFWPGEKDEQSCAYAKRANGDYLWQVDIDEFYRDEDIKKIFSLLKEQPLITAMTFKMITFWGGFNVITDGWYLRRGASYYHRLFRWGPGYQYSTHRPPTIVDEKGRNLRNLHWIDGKTTERLGILMYHYSLLFPKQVLEKCDYYQQADWAKRKKANQWAQENYNQLKDPYRVHNVYDYPSWLLWYKGSHPTQIEKMKEDIKSGKINISMRGMDDVYHLLNSKKYSMGINILKLLDYINRGLQIPISVLHRFVQFSKRSINKYLAHNIAYKKE
jgi:hypothetical protein